MKNNQDFHREQEMTLHSVSKQSSTLFNRMNKSTKRLGRKSSSRVIGKAKVGRIRRSEPISKASSPGDIQAKAYIVTVKDGKIVSSKMVL